MKRIIILTLFVLPFLIKAQGSIEVTFTNQADFDAYNFTNGQSYRVLLKNDTNLPVGAQINNLLPLASADSIYLYLEHTLISDLSDIPGIANFTLNMEGNKNFDTLFISDNVLGFNLICNRTYLRYIHGGANIEVGGNYFLYDNDHLQNVNLDLGEMDTSFQVNPTILNVAQNDSLKTFYWGNPHNQLSALSFYENRALKHIHIETAKEKVSAISVNEGGFVFNPELDSISGFKGLENSWITQIRMNYKLNNACVLQKGTQTAINIDPNVTSAYIVENNGSNLQSLNDLLTADCSWLPNGVEEPTFSNLKIYPNPAHDEVYVGVPEKTTQYVIYSVAGKLVQQGTVENSGRIGLANLPNGLYVLQIENNRSKLVVQ